MWPVVGAIILLAGAVLLGVGETNGNRLIAVAGILHVAAGWCTIVASQIRKSAR